MKAPIPTCGVKQNLDTRTRYAVSRPASSACPPTTSVINDATACAAASGLVSKEYAVFRTNKESAAAVGGGIAVGLNSGDSVCEVRFGNDPVARVCARKAGPLILDLGLPQWIAGVTIVYADASRVMLFCEVSASVLESGDEAAWRTLVGAYADGRGGPCGALTSTKFDVFGPRAQVHSAAVAGRYLKILPLFWTHGSAGATSPRAAAAGHENVGPGPCFSVTVLTAKTPLHPARMGTRVQSADECRHRCDFYPGCDAFQVVGNDTALKSHSRCYLLFHHHGDQDYAEKPKGLAKRKACVRNSDP
eukprot:g13279.t1